MRTRGRQPRWHVLATVTAALLLVTACGTGDVEITVGPEAALADTGDTEDDGPADDDAADGPDAGRDGRSSASDDEEGREVAASATEAADPEPATATASVDGELEVRFLDVGQGDATLLVHPEAAVLIDTGRHQASDVVPAVRAAGVDTLDLVIVTHPHADHLGQFDQVLDQLTVHEVWWSGSTTTTQTFDRALAALERSEAAYEEPRAGDTALLGPLELEVVNPPAGTGLGDLHDANLAIRVTYGAVRLLFTGDAEAPTETRMVARSAATLDADILQLGHHGSSTSTTAGFLAAVDPAVAVYSASSTNPYGHPHAEVLDRLRAAGVDVYGTAVHGTVTVTTDGRTWSVATARQGTPTPGGSSSSGANSSSGSSGSSASSPRPSPTPSPTASAAPASEACAPGQVDVNTASHDELQRIIHIGPDRAQQIPGLRPFGDVRQLDRISGIGPARLDDILAQGVACAS
jgi:competence protein ComEC